MLGYNFYKLNSEMLTILIKKLKANEITPLMANRKALKYCSDTTLLINEYQQELMLDEHKRKLFSEWDNRFITRKDLIDLFSKAKKDIKKAERYNLSYE